MATETQTPREEVESFINDMLKVHSDYYDGMTEAYRKSDAAVKACGTYATQEQSERRIAAQMIASKLGEEYRKAQGKVMESHQAVMPSDFYSSYCWSETSNFHDFVISIEKKINKNKMKIYAQRNGKPGGYCVFTLEYRNDKWIITRIRWCAAETMGKEETFFW